MFIVTVEFIIRPQNHQDFLTKINQNAQTSMTNEKDCLQFDVCCSNEDKHHVFLYEVYTNQAAFHLHLASEHFLTFNEATSDWVLEKTVKTFHKVETSAPQTRGT